MKTAHWSRVGALVAIVALGLCVGDAGATTLYEQTPIVTEQGIFSNVGGQEAADDFSLLANASVTDVIWYGHYAGTDLSTPLSTIEFAISFLTDSSGLPGTLIAPQEWVDAAVADTGLAMTAGPHTGSTVYEFSASIAPVSIPGATTTWISIAEDDDSTPRSGDTQWLWNRSSSTGGLAYMNSTDPWTASSGNTAFTLQGIVPLPAAAWMGLSLLGAVGGVSVLRRKRRKG